MGDEPGEHESDDEEVEIKTVTVTPVEVQGDRYLEQRFRDPIQSGRNTDGEYGGARDVSDDKERKDRIDEPPSAPEQEVGKNEEFDDSIDLELRRIEMDIDLEPHR